MRHLCTRLMIFLVIAVTVHLPQVVAAKNGDYLMGIFGVPEGNFAELQKAGLNSLLVRSFEVQRAKGLNLKKIYVLGLTPKTIRERIDQSPSFEEKLNLFKQAGDAHNYYLGDDLKCKQAEFINNIKKRANIQRGIVGVLQGMECYPQDDILKYHYPLMRRQTSLPEMLRKQVEIANYLHTTNRRLYLCPQSHPQMWYLETIKLSNISEKAKLYPDGQVVRMLIYYALATDADGYFLYDHKALSGQWSRERLLGAAQGIIETQPLVRLLARSTGAEFFHLRDRVFGTKIASPDCDVYFVFHADSYTHHHPTTNTIRQDLHNIIPGKTYKAVYEYSPLGLRRVAGPLEIPQDHALILIGLKNNVTLTPLKLGSQALESYAQILQARADQLAANLTLLGLSIPPRKDGHGSVTGRIASLVKYLDTLNELKRTAWLQASANRLPMDGDILNQLFWKKKPLPSQRHQLFNFYYR